MLSKAFLDPYYKRGDVFRSLLARSTYLNKYCREGECWTDTIRRVVEGNVALDPSATVQEAEQLFHAFWNMWAMPPGRGLWVGGVPGIPAEGRYNCWGVAVRSIEDWCWMMDQLMLGGGVGANLNYLSSLGRVEPYDAKLSVVCTEGHPDVKDVAPDTDHSPCLSFEVPDSREGWVHALRMVLRCAFSGTSIRVDVSKVRPHGTPIRTFGGTACGPGPLVTLLRGVWNILRACAGRALNVVDALDVTTMIGKCVSSGNVRRSALLTMASYSEEFLRVKEDTEKLMSHRYSSNNTLCVEELAHFNDLDYQRLAENCVLYGDPGLFNQELIRKTDPGAVIVNPCGEIPLHPYESCNLSELFPARCPPGNMLDTIRLTTRYTLRQRLDPMRDGPTDMVRKNNMRLGVGLGGLCDFAWDKEILSSWYQEVRDAAYRYADHLGVNRPIALTTTKPSGTISLLADSSPGIHAPYAPFYIRRVRVPVNDPIAAALQEAGVPYEPCVYNAKSYVFEFPTKAKHNSAFAQRETVRDQLERNLAVQQYWADNSVSATISFESDRTEELAAELKVFAPKLKTCSFLSRSHGFQQAPYEEISEEQFWQRYNVINHDAPLVHGSNIEIEECAGGACPARLASLRLLLMISAQLLSAMSSSLQEKVALPRYERAIQEGLIDRGALVDVPDVLTDPNAVRRYTRGTLAEPEFVEPAQLERTRQLKDKLYRQQARSAEAVTGNIRALTTPHPGNIAATAPLQTPAGRIVGAQVWVPETSGGFIRALAAKDTPRALGAQLASAARPDLLPTLLGSHPMDRSVNLATLQHEFGEANEFLRGAAPARVWGGQ